jgi:hypothetical protein
VDRSPIITRSEVTWVVFILGGIAFLVAVAVAVFVGSVLTALPFVLGAAVAFAVVVLVAALAGIYAER